MTKDAAKAGINAEGGADRGMGGHEIRGVDGKGGDEGEGDVIRNYEIPACSSRRPCHQACRLVVDAAPPRRDTAKVGPAAFGLEAMEGNQVGWVGVQIANDELRPRGPHGSLRVGGRQKLLSLAPSSQVSVAIDEAIENNDQDSEGICDNDMR